MAEYLASLIKYREILIALSHWQNITAWLVSYTALEIIIALSHWQNI